MSTLAKLVFISCVSILAACNGTTTTTADAGTDSGMPYPCSQVTFCTLQGDFYVCDCDGGSAPACPASANPSEPCDYPANTSCVACSEGATQGCICTDAGGISGQADASGSHWECVGGGRACQ